MFTGIWDESEAITKIQINIQRFTLVRFLFQKFNPFYIRMLISGLVAQWLEHTLDKRGVASSTLARPTIDVKKINQV